MNKVFLLGRLGKDPRFSANAGTASVCNYTVATDHFLLGRLGKDPRFSANAGTASVCNFTVATDHYTKDGKKTVWVDVAVWGEQATACSQYLKKGSQVFVEATLQEPNVFTKQDGQTVASLRVNAKSVKFLGSKNDQASEDTDFQPPY